MSRTPKVISAKSTNAMYKQTHTAYLRNRIIWTNDSLKIVVRKATIVLLLSLYAILGYTQDGGIALHVESNEFTGINLEKNNSGIVQYNPTAGVAISSYKISNVITLSVLEETTSYLPNDFSASVTVKLDYGHSPEQLNSSLTKELIVNYSKGQSVKYNAKNYISFTGAECVRITIVDIKFNPESDESYHNFDRRSVIALHNELKATCYYSLNTNARVINLSSFFSGGTDPDHTDPNMDPAKPDGLAITWGLPDDAGNNQVQLEWTWLDNDWAANYTVDGKIQYDALFNRNATRVDLPAQSIDFTLPMLYNGIGKVYYRVRLTNTNKDWYRSGAPWEYGNSDEFTGHESKLNWQATTSFAEEGKYKTVIQYYDGSLRSRQTVTKNNTDNTTVSAETLYDNEGRPAIQILPAPGINNTIAYTRGLNLFNNQSVNTNPADLFDYNSADYPGTTTPPLASAADLSGFGGSSSQQGASRYYSPYNSEIQSGNNSFIPDAQGYPYSVTKYTPDGTGRIKAQSGVGYDLKMGSGHETKYYYGSASQEELDALFGTEVGNYTHYFKNMVLDANGQTSVSYVDMHGRTIATALAGNPINTGIAKLDLNQTDYPNQAGTTISRNLISGSTNIAKGNKIESVGSLLVPVAGSYTFNYSVTPDKLEAEACDKAPLCYDCLYDLEIAVINEEDDEKNVESNNGPVARPGEGNNNGCILAPITKKYTNIRLAPADQCNPENAEFIETESGNRLEAFCVNLEPGSYTIRKTLTVNESYLQLYKQMYLQKALCKTQEDISDSLYSEMDKEVGCAADPQPPRATCESCKENLGDYNTFRTNYLLSMGLATDDVSPDPATDLNIEISAQYNTALARCNSLNPNVSHSLDQIRSMMLADMMPYAGQYAKGLDEIVTVMDRTYNIFSVSSGKAPYKNPNPDYLNRAGGNFATLYYDSHNKPDNTINSQLSGINDYEFTQLFKYSWAYSLLPYHPEYPRLIWAENNLKTSYDWIDQMMNYDKYDDAKSNNKVPVLSATGSADPASVNDPFYQITANAGNEKTMYGWVNKSYRDVKNTSYHTSMWQIAYGDVKCKTKTEEDDRNSCYTKATAAPGQPDFEALTPDEKDQVWNTFKSLYAGERNRQMNAYIASNNSLPNTKELVNEKFILRFPDNDEQVATQAGWTSTNSNGETPAWYPTGGFTTTSQPVSYPTNDNTTQTYTNRCESYIEMWKQQLLQCETLNNRDDKDAIINAIVSKMEDVCTAGSDQANPFGSSTAPNTTGNTFENVINTIFHDYNIPKDSYCNPFSIEFPKPHNKGPEMATMYAATLDDCNCQLFAKLKKDSKAEDLGGFNEFLNRKYGPGSAISEQLYNSLNNCDKTKTTVQTGVYDKPVDYWSDETPNCNSSCEVTHPVMAPGNNSLDAGRRIADTNFISKFLDRSTSLIIGGGQTNVTSCQEGYEWNSEANKCLPKVPEDDDCPPGYRWDGKQCVSEQPTPICSTNYHWDGKQCVPDQPLPPVICKHTTVSCPTDPVEIRILSSPQPIPRFLQCGYGTDDGQNCLTCAQFSSLINEFKHQFDGTPYNDAPFFGPDVLSSDQLEANMLFARFINFRTGFQYDWVDYAKKAAEQNCPVDNYLANIENNITTDVICANSKPLNEQTDMILQETPCEKVRNMADAMAAVLYEERQKQVLTDFETAYKAKCLAVKNAEQFTVTYTNSEYHYTLYYYDMAGNLVKTVPPKGVNPYYMDRDGGMVREIEDAKTNGRQAVPNHTLATDYRYNSLNAVTEQHTPDGGTSQFWYDALGRLAVSQNAKQLKASQYSYTSYDPLGRITEVGQVKQAIPMSQTISQDIKTEGNPSLYDWININARDQITHTYYDEAFLGGDLSDLITQQNLRNRVSWSAVYPDALSAGDVVRFASATFYTYDVHGNVDVLLQNFGSKDYQPNAMNRSGNAIKRIRYQYDLISGKVNGVSYQPPVWELKDRNDPKKGGSWQPQPDAFYHRYEYDAENRILNVQTSRDSIVWERDANYSYYKHGALSQTVLGQLQVQGLKYAYTVQGWLKGVNVSSGRLKGGMEPIHPHTEPPAADPGATTSSIAGSVYSYLLSYNAEDYVSIGGSNPSGRMVEQLQAFGSYKPLYNGNIAAMGVTINGLERSPSMVYNYGYDQLNRLVNMYAYDAQNNVYDDMTATKDYAEAVSYDPNGNIRTYFRDGVGNNMDNLMYQYPKESGTGTPLNNRLRGIFDAVPSDVYPTDIDNQTRFTTREEAEAEQSPENGDDNYQYDEIGNLVRDRSGNIDRIDWTVYGKIARINKTPESGNQKIAYTYDASGNRISKLLSVVGSEATFYVRDGQGNVMAVYEGNDERMTQNEIDLYGSSRLGLVSGQTVATEELQEVPEEFGPAKVSTFTRGEKQYELSNHLGNVLTTISDRKQQLTGDNRSVSSYTAEVVSATDYYPFGMQMPGRTKKSAGYRYGFNGKELNKDIANDDYDFGARIYDGRLGRWLSTDPLQSKYPDVSPYSYCYNNPIHFTDENGKWVRDQNGNVIVTIDKKMTTNRGGVYAIGSASTQYVIKGNWGYIMSNNGTKVEVFVPNSNTVIKETFNAQGNVTGTTDVTSSCDGEKNCTTNSLLPSTSSIVISSNQITDDILKSEGFIKGSEIEKNVKDLANSGEKAAQGFSINKITKKGDIVVYGSGSGQYAHFEYFENSTTVDTKGGVQKGPITASPGQNPYFSNPQIYINTNVGGWKDPKVNTTGGKTANGQTTVDNKQFNKIQTDVKAKTP